MLSIRIPSITGLAFSLSHLLIATTKAAPAERAILMDSMVCSITKKGIVNLSIDEIRLVVKEFMKQVSELKYAYEWIQVWIGN